MRPASGRRRSARQDARLVEKLREASANGVTEEALTFTREEFGALEVKDLRQRDYLEVDGVYYSPFEVGGQRAE